MEVVPSDGPMQRAVKKDEDEEDKILNIKERMVEKENRNLQYNGGSSWSTSSPMFSRIST